MTSAQLIAEARRAAGLTQARLAARAGTSQPTLSLYERGAREPRAQTLRRILRAAGADLQLVVTGERVVEPTPSELRQRGEILAALLDAVDAFPLGDPGPMRAPRLIDLTKDAEEVSAAEEMALTEVRRELERLVGVADHRLTRLRQVASDARRT